MYKVIIVEDEPPIARYLCRMLGELDDDFLVAAVGNNGEEGLELFDKHRPDLVITDVRMPGMNGLQMIEKMKESDENTQFLIISDYQDFEYARDGLRLGVHNYLIKPVTARQLEENLQKVKEIFEKERKKDNHQILRDLINGKTETAGTELLKKQGLKWQLILIQQGCVLNPQMKYLIRSEEPADSRLREPESLIAVPEHVIAWMAQNDSNVIVCLWNGEEILFDEEMVLHDSQKTATTVVCSAPFDNPELIPSLYSQCGKILYYQTIIGKDQFFDGSRLSTGERYDTALSSDKVLAWDAIFPETEQEIIQAVKLNSFDLLKQGLLSLFAWLERSNTPQYALENVLQNLFFLLAEKRKITMEQQQEGIAEILYCSKTMEDVLGGLLNLILSGWEIGEDQAKNRNKGQQMMENIDQYIHRNLNEVFSLQDLSETFYLSKTYICRLFRDYKGMSFKDYIIGIKMDQAKELLEKGESVKTVSEYLGYMDPFYFSKVFKKREGISPSEYMKKIFK